jgi:hypothetical protein
MAMLKQQQQASPDTSAAATQNSNSSSSMGNSANTTGRAALSALFSATARQHPQYREPNPDQAAGIRPDAGWFNIADQSESAGRQHPHE